MSKATMSKAAMSKATMSKARPRSAMAVSAISRKREHAASAFRLEAHVFYLFSRILATRNRVLNAELAGHGLDYPRWRVLAVLNQHPGCSMLQLAELTAVDRTTLAHTVGRLVQGQLVDRAERTSDRRSVALALTPRGRSLLQSILPAVTAQNDRALAGFSTAEAAHLRALLRRILQNIT